MATTTAKGALRRRRWTSFGVHVEGTRMFPAGRHRRALRDLGVGVENPGAEDCTNHRNAKNPFTGEQVPEPGRLFFTDPAFGY